MLGILVSLALLIGPYQILGTPQADLIYGGPTGGAINALAGNDRIVDTYRSKDVAYGGSGNDYIRTGPNGPDSTDDIFGGGFCRETGYYGFERRAQQEGWPDPSTIPCSYDGADVLRGGSGPDWLWESNSDIAGDGKVDVLNGGRGYDICTAEAEDIVRNCEVVRIIPPRGSL